MDNATPDAFGGFGFTIRSFWIEAKDLHVGRVWRKDPLGSSGAPEFTSGIHGIAVPEKDGVCVIGGPEIMREFELTLKVDTNAQRDWEWHKACSGTNLHINKKAPDEIVRIMKLIEERLNEDPPTATLFTYESDWEIGIKAGWSIECLIPQEVYAKIEEELSAGHIQSVRLGVEWEAGLVQDKHAPPSFPTVWGMFRIADNQSPEPLRGHVTSVSWTPNEQIKATPLEGNDHDEAPLPSLTNSAGTASQISGPVVVSVSKGIVFALWAIAFSVFLLFIK